MVLDDRGLGVEDEEVRSELILVELLDNVGIAGEKVVGDTTIGTCAKGEIELAEGEIEIGT
jgi:hypothetical protein